MSRRFATAVVLAGVVVVIATSGCRQPRALGGGDGQVVQLAAQQAPSPPRGFSLIAVGDVMLDRNVGKAIAANGYRSILERVRDELRAADLTFANLECPLSTVGPHNPVEYLLFRADPATVKVLTDGGIDVVALANNHALNAGSAGLRQTMQHLDNAGIAYCGAHPERERSWEPCRFIVGDLEVGFVACTDLSFEHGSWCKVDQDLSAFRERIGAAAARCDLLVVSIHWGNEYQNQPTARQQEVARAAIEAGADLIIGHHPHVLQGIGSYQGVPILYSAGNFVFDQREGERMESCIFHLDFDEAEGWSIRVVPVWIARSRMGPIYPDGQRAQQIISRMARLSQNLGVQLTVQGVEGRVTIKPERRLSPPVAERPASVDVAPAAATG